VTVHGWAVVAAVAHIRVRHLPDLVVRAMGWINRAKREART
jgi:hypothetical protein